MASDHLEPRRLAVHEGGVGRGGAGRGEPPAGARTAIDLKQAALGHLLVGGADAAAAHVDGGAAHPRERVVERHGVALRTVHDVGRAPHERVRRVRPRVRQQLSFSAVSIGPTRQPSPAQLRPSALSGGA